MPELKAKFTVDNSQFASKLNESKNQLAGLKGVFGGIIGGFGVHQVVQFASSVANVASELADASDALGIATTDLQALQVFAIKAGLPLEKLEGVLNRIGTARLDAIADPTGEAAKNFAALGISVKNLSAMSVTQSIAGLGKQMALLADNEKAMSAAKDIIGVRSHRAIGVIRDYGAIGPQAAKDAAAGYMMEEKAVKSLDEALDKLALTKKKIQSTAGNVAAELIDPQSDWFIGLRAPESFSDRIDRERSKAATKDNRKRETGILSRDTARVSEFISNPSPMPEFGKPFSLVDKSIKEAMERQLKTASQMNVSDPFAAVGRAAGRDSGFDTLGTLRKIEENTRRIQPTPAPLMR